MDGISKLCHSLWNATFSVYILYLSIVLNNDTAPDIMIPKIRFSIMFEGLTLLFFSYSFNDLVQPFNLYTLPFHDFFNRYKRFQLSV